MTTTLDVSAQFGGRDAARALLAHFQALKAALSERSFDGFHCRQLAFILRVDGEVNVYGRSGPSNVQFGGTGAYVSVDVGITTKDRMGRGPAELSAFVAAAIMSSMPLLRGLRDSRLDGVNWEALEVALQGFSDAYKARFRGS